MITRAWGSWSLFQELLMVLRTIADKYEGMSIANVATRWVLDHPFVGAAIIGNEHRRELRPGASELIIFSGVRMGVSEHTDDNQKVYGFRLDADDRGKIEAVLSKSNGAQLIRSIGDCGAEYR